jgi:hypothetical protein
VGRGLGHFLPLFGVALLALGLGCAGGRTTGQPRDSGAKDETFPTREEVRDLASQAPAAESPVARFRTVSAWSIEAPTTDRVGEDPISAPDGWEELLLEVAAERAGLVVASEGMRCAAREFGRFFLEHSALPAPDLHRFLLARCGTSSVGATTAYVEGVLPGEEDASDAEIRKHWDTEARTLLRTHLGAGPRAVGVWFGRRAGRGTLMFLSGERRVRIDPISPVPGADGALVLRGEVLSTAQEVRGIVNQGRHGWAFCEGDPSVRPPAFALRCPTDPKDGRAWILVAARRPGRVLSDGVLQVLARPSGASALGYRAPHLGRELPIATADEFREQLAREVNRVRREAGAPPLSLEPNQSELAAQLAPTYIGAHFGQIDPATADAVALGLLAGWEMEGPIRDGGVGASVALDTRDFATWLAQALEEPGLRSTLLDPDRSRLAVGAVVASPDAPASYLAGLVATYELYGAADPRAELEAFHERLVSEYAARGLTPPHRDADVEAAALRYLERARSGRQEPEEALRDLLAETGARFGASVQGFWLEGMTLDQLVLPAELLTRDVRRVAAAVGWYQPPDSPWGRTLVFVVVLPDGAERRAEAAPAPDARG